MPLQVMLADEDRSIPIPLDDSVREAWLLQYDRATTADSVDGFMIRLAVCFAGSLAECLDPDLKPPTDAQLKYGTDIARELGIPLHAEALRFRGAMTEFIDRHAIELKERRDRRHR